MLTCMCAQAQPVCSWNFIFVKFFATNSAPCQPGVHSHPGLLPSGLRVGVWCPGAVTLGMGGAVMLHSSHLHPRVQTGEVAGRLPCVLSASPRPAGKLCRHR